MDDSLNYRVERRTADSPFPAEKGKKGNRFRYAILAPVLIALLFGMAHYLNFCGNGGMTGTLDRDINDIHDLTVRMYACLQSWRASNLPAREPRSGSVAGRTQVDTVEAFFTFLSKAQFPDVESSGNPDREFRSWLHRAMPDKSVRQRFPNLDTRPPSPIKRQKLEKELRDLAIGISAAGLADMEGDSPPATDDPFMLLRAALDYQNWYVGQERKWRYGGRYVQDGESRAIALDFCREPTPGLVDYDQVRLLRKLLVELGCDDFDTDDVTERPWLLLASFCEFFSLERLGFDADTYDETIVRLFPLRPVVPTADFSREKFASSVPLHMMEELARFLHGQETKGKLFGDMLGEVRDFYLDPRNYHRELRRLDGVPNPTGAHQAYRAMLESIVNALATPEEKP